jgi:hypothetical protein
MGSELSTRAAPGVLLVCPSAEDAALMSDALGDISLSHCISPEEAFRHLNEHNIGLIIATYVLNDTDGVAFLDRCRTLHPTIVRMLWASYDEMQAVLKKGKKDVYSRVLPKPGKAAVHKRVVDNLLKPSEATTGSTEGLGDARAWADAYNVMRNTAVHGCQISGSVIRPMPDDPQCMELQLVLPKNEDYEALRTSLPEKWNWPLKPMDQSLSRKAKKHPVVVSIGEIWDNQELYVRAIGDTDGFLYAMFLPWEREEKLTLILGLCVPTVDGRHQVLLKDIHNSLTQEVSQFVVPDYGENTAEREQGAYVAEYDWVVTPQYVGPERRDKPTGILNAYLYIGKRLHIPHSILTRSGGFVDKMQKWVWVCLLVYLGLSTMDTVLTWVYVSQGTFTELNPLLRPLIGQHPWGFVLVKNSLSILSFLLVARFQLMLPGKILLGLNLFLYFALDVYWLILLWPRLFGG